MFADCVSEDDAPRLTTYHYQKCSIIRYIVTFHRTEALLLTAELRPAEEEVTTLTQVRAAGGSSPVSWLLRRVAGAD